ncbi:RNA polymerase sigma-I factor [Paenibacillus abyssi]|uniref:RNA polymerase sigma-I factor n=1 Tax=Paenibacillus abyssi TaxID=1340531 RepID=UPI001E501DE9|nr:RNA polymerase sigma-I factor [Paenibacillus abyssi]
MEKILQQAQNGDSESRERLIQQYRPFIIRASSHICKRQIRWDDDEASISLIAFNEAIDRYGDSHGKSFDNYAYTIIHNRLVDDFRKRSRSWGTEKLLMGTGNEFELSAIEVASSLEAFELQQSAGELAEELVSYDETLQAYGISLEELEDCCPSHRDTRIQLVRIAKGFIAYPALMAHLRKTKQLPLKEMLNYSKVSRKTLERNRKYLISLILIYSSDEFIRIRNTISFGEIGE